MHRNIMATGSHIMKLNYHTAWSVFKKSESKSNLTLLFTVHLCDITE